MPLTDPYKIRLGEDLLAYLDTLPDAPETVRAAIRWQRALDLTEASVAELVSARNVVQLARRLYTHPLEALDAILTDVGMRVVDDLAALERAGWDKPYLCAAADILNGTWMQPWFGVGGIRVELLDGERLVAETVDGAPREAPSESYAAKHGGDAARFRALVGALTEPIARALRDVVIEFWRGNRVAEARLGYGPSEV